MNLSRASEQGGIYHTYQLASTSKSIILYNKLDFDKGVYLRKPGWAVILPTMDLLEVNVGTMENLSS